MTNVHYDLVLILIYEPSSFKTVKFSLVKSQINLEEFKEEKLNSDFQLFQ